MEANLQHEDLLIKLRGKLNEEKIKLWESPYISSDSTFTQNLQDLAKKYSTELSVEYETLLQGLHELQMHSVDRSKANAEFKETGYATFRIKAVVPGDKPKILKIQKKLDEMGSAIISAVATEVGVAETRIKLIYNGKVIKPEIRLEEQGLRNGVQIMALIMAESPEEASNEDKRYMEMKTTRDDAALLSECVDDLGDDDDYMKLEDQSGKTIQLPPGERRALLVGLALHERGKVASHQKDYALALVLLLEADRQFSECSSSLLKAVDNWAVLQLDIAWCYLCLQNLSSAADAEARLLRAEEAFKASYGENHERLIALKGTAANERVLIMRLYLLQGIVAYHQNKRCEARTLLDKAEVELDAVRVDETSVQALEELGWSRAQARCGLRATKGKLDAAHHFLEEARRERRAQRHRSAADRRERLLGTCVDGSPVKSPLVQALVDMGYDRRTAAKALKNSNNHVAEAVRLIQDHPEMLEDSDSSEETGSPSSEESLLEVEVEADNKLVAELEAMGYDPEEAKTALRMVRNHIAGAVDLLVSGGGHVIDVEEGNPSTSTGPDIRKHKKLKKDKKRKEREMALDRLKTAIMADRDEDDPLDTSLAEEEQYLAQYKSLL